MSALSDLVADRIQLLGRERTFADSSAIRFDDADDAINFLRRNARSHAHAAADRMARRHIRIRPVVNVEHRGLRALE